MDFKAITKKLRGNTFSKGGVHPPEHKETADNAIIDVELPRTATLLMSQHIGAPAKPVVKKGDKVKRGDMVAEAGGFVSAPVHTPISGTVTKIDKVRGSDGFMKDAIIITADDEEHVADMKARAEVKPVRSAEEIAALTPQEIVDIVSNAGIVGLGGATFPTRVKLSPPPGSKAEVLVVNGAECEPWLTDDDRLMRENAQEIVEGVRLLMRAVGVNRAVIGVERNKPEAIEKLQNASMTYNDVEVVPLKVKYPQGGEKQLIEALTGREVPSGALPIAVGAIVQNITTAAAVLRAVKYGEPLMERTLTVTGPEVEKPGNFRVAFGTPLTDVIALTGPLPENTGKVILGGPMMGRTASNLDTPTTKGMSAVLILPESQSKREEVQPCIRCARCVSVCPMGLEPYLISTLSRLGRYEDAEPEHIMDCIECGSCSYICPSHRPLLDYIRLGKKEVGAIIRARKADSSK